MNMDELGSILREARETKGLTLSQVQEQIRISERFLSAMESGEYEVLPTPVHVRGYLRNYARFLELDPDPLLERYQLNQQGAFTRAALKKGSNNNGSRNGSSVTIPEIDNQPFFNPVNVELDSSFGHQSGSTLRLVIIIALIVAIGLVANRFIPLLTGQGDGTIAFQQVILEMIQNEDPEAEPTAELNSSNLFIEDSALGATDLITSTSRNSSGTAVPAPTPTRRPLPATMETIQLRLDITERTWVLVTIDGEVALEDMVTPEDSPLEWEALQEARVKTGNAIGVFITVNGIEQGKMGGRSEVVEESWQATGN